MNGKRDLNRMTVKHSRVERGSHRAPAAGDDAARILELEADLATARALLQERIEEWATTSEELRDANAELVEANGLLHDTSERLGIANTELHALNLELRNRIAEADRAYADLENLFESTRVATIFVDRAGRVRRFTPTVGEILAVGPETLGAALAPLLAPLTGLDAGALIARVMADGAPVEHEFGTATGAWYQLRVLPYRTRQGAVDGAVITFADLTASRTAALAMSNVNEQLERRVGERTGQLAESLRELESFSYSISHDLKAPLRAIHGFSQALSEEFGATLGDAGLHYLERIRTGATRMGSLIDDLLTLSRVARAEIHPTTVPLSGLADEVVAELRRADPQRDVRVTIAPALSVDGDASLLRALLTNLLGNAWKFTRRRATAHIEFGECETPRGHAYFVRDDGAGFDMAYADKLFGAFQRLHEASEFEGTGIGLATARRIVARHGGAIWADGAVDRGATFSFTLPSAH